MSADPNTLLYLEFLQKSYYANNDFLLDHSIKKTASQVIETIRNQGLRVNNDVEELFQKLDEQVKLPTPYEDPISYFIMTNLAREIEQSIVELRFRLPVRPLLGTIPSGRLNAMTILVRRTNEFIVLFERQLFGFAYEMSKIIAQVIPFEGVIGQNIKFAISKEKLSQIEKNLSRHPEIENQMREVVIAYLMKGNPNIIEPTLVSWPSYPLAGILTNSAELFILGHEYGHILCGHFDQSKLVQSFIGEEQVVQVVPQWNQEHEADMKGLELMIHAQQRNQTSVVTSFWGADFFFSCMDILERGISFVETGNEGDRRLNDHPPTALRREVIRQGLMDSLPKDIGEPAINLGMFLESIMEMLFKGMCPYLMQLNKMGYQLADRWKIKKISNCSATVGCNSQY